MKTNQVMIREDGFKQRTSDGYFSGTELLNRWNFDNPSKRKEIAKYKKNKETSCFINQLKEEGISNPYISSNKGTWMHPKLFVDFAMWLSVEFKSKVIDFVLDGLIKTRCEAGDYYNEMCASILKTYVEHYGAKPPAHIYITEARRIKNMVTDKKDRNEMAEQELNQITYLQKVNANLIQKGIGKESRIKRLNEANEILI